MSIDLPNNCVPKTAHSVCHAGLPFPQSDTYVISPSESFHLEVDGAALGCFFPNSLSSLDKISSSILTNFPYLLYSFVSKKIFPSTL